MMNTQIDTAMPSIVFTDNAANHVKTLIVNEDNANLNLRIFVKGGGCSGLSYSFTFDEEINEDDTVIMKNDVRLLIDSISFQYLDGATIDYQESLQGSQFVIKNPNSTSHCGCGSSFAV